MLASFLHPVCFVLYVMFPHSARPREDGRKPRCPVALAGGEARCGGGTHERPRRARRRRRQRRRGRSRQGRTKRWTPRRRRRSRAPSASASAAEAEAEAEGGAATTTTRRGGGMRLRLVPMSASCCTYSTFLKVYFRVPPAGRLAFEFQNFAVRQFFTPGWRGRKLCGTLCAPAAARPCPVRSRPRMDAVRTRSSSTCPIRISIPSPAREMSEQWR